MRSLHKAVRSPNKGGTPLPSPFASFDKYDIAIRRGEATMIAAPPGAGKSTVALAMALKMKVPTLYFSMDSGEDTQGTRALSMLTGMSTKAVEAALLLDPITGANKLREGSDHIKWVFEADDLYDLEEEIDVYTEVMGSPPQLVVIDNATDLNHESGDEYSSLRSLMREVKRWSRDINAAFLVLHHTSESFHYQVCPPKASVHGKINQKPAVILTIGNPQDGLLPISPVKNRTGFSDATGNTAVWLEYEPSTMTLRDRTFSPEMYEL